MKDMTTPASELSELLAKATPLPWRHFANDRKLMKGGHQIDAVFGPDKKNGRSGVDRVVHWAGFDSANETLKRKRANAALIVAAVNALPFLLQSAGKVERLQGEVARLKGALEIIAGKRQCLDNLMSNQDIALVALAAQDAPTPQVAK